MMLGEFAQLGKVAPIRADFGRARKYCQSAFKNDIALF
jgi:hypothetical protein